MQNVFNLGKEKLERIKTKVLSDSDRLEKCQQIVDLESKRSQIVNDKIMSYKEKTEQKRILAIVSTLLAQIKAALCSKKVFLYS